MNTLEQLKIQADQESIERQKELEEAVVQLALAVSVACVEKGTV